jgi:tetratricopeptide (TPR) repeat protein
VTHLEPDNGEAWTNLAALWLQQGGWKEALQASEQAVKYKRDSWQTWDNYATAAAKAGVMSGCVRALTQVGRCVCGVAVVGVGI